MQLKRLVSDPAYLERMVCKGGAFFQSWNNGRLREERFAPAIAADVMFIFGKRTPLPETALQVLKEIERQAPEADLLPIVFEFGWMAGKAHERWRVRDPEAKRLLRTVRRK